MLTSGERLSQKYLLKKIQPRFLKIHVLPKITVFLPRCSFFGWIIIINCVFHTEVRTNLGQNFRKDRVALEPVDIIVGIADNKHAEQ